MSRGSSISWLSGCPEKYPRIGGSDNPVTEPEEFYSEEEATLMDEGSSTNSSGVRHLQDLARCLHERSIELEDAAQLSNQKQQSLLEYNEALSQRVCDLMSNRHPRVRALQNLTHCLQERINELEAATHTREEEKTQDVKMTDALTEKVSSLCTFNCTMVVELDASKGLARRYRATILFMVIGIVLVGIFLSLFLECYASVRCKEVTYRRLPFETQVT